MNRQPNLQDNSSEEVKSSAQTTLVQLVGRADLWLKNKLLARILHEHVDSPVLTIKMSSCRASLLGFMIFHDFWRPLDTLPPFPHSMFPASAWARHVDLSTG